MQEGDSEKIVETSHTTVVRVSGEHRTIRGMIVRHKRIFRATCRNGHVTRAKSLRVTEAYCYRLIGRHSNGAIILSLLLSLAKNDIFLMEREMNSRFQAQYILKIVKITEKSSITMGFLFHCFLHNFCKLTPIKSCLKMEMIKTL